MFNFSPGRETADNMKVLRIQEFPFTPEQVKEAFRTLAKKVHPDSGTASASDEQFAKVNNAYKYLMNISAMLSSEEEKVCKEPLSTRVKKQCPRCEGAGRVEYTFFRDVQCEVCSDQSKHIRRGKIEVTCNQCDNGTFTLRSGRKVACRRCKGSGKVIIRCQNCFGEGFTKQTIRNKNVCPKCKGHGEVKLDLFNPVIKEEAVLI